MVTTEDIKKYKDMEASDLRLWIVGFEAENRILKQQIESIRSERNALMMKLSGIDFIGRSNPNGNNNPIPKVRPLDTGVN